MFVFALPLFWWYYKNRPDGRKIQEVIPLIKKTDLLAAAARVIQTKGLNNLTLEAVANEAGVSKGGLLYHFSSKEELIKGLNEHSLQVFQALVQEDYNRTGNYVQAYLNATFQQMNDPSDLCPEASLLAAIANQKGLLTIWESEYQLFRQKMNEEVIPFEKGMLVRLVCDGLLLSKMFKLDPLSEQEENRVLAYLTTIMQEEQKT
jgi:AcrR family transcriptional regulator